MTREPPIEKPDEFVREDVPIRDRNRAARATRSHIPDKKMRQAATRSANRTEVELYREAEASSVPDPGLTAEPIELVIGLAKGIFFSTEEEKNLALAFTEKIRRIPLEEAYTTPAIRGRDGTITHPSGSQLFRELLESSLKGGDYPFTRSQRETIANAKYDTANTTCVEIGPADGDLIKLITELNGPYSNYIFGDIVPPYLENTTEALVSAGIERKKITNILADAFASNFFPEIWDKIIAPKLEAKVAFHCYGNTLNNDKLFEFLRELRPRLKIGHAEVFLGLDSTWDEEKLQKAYKELDKWLKNAMSFVIERKLNLEGFDPSKVRFSPKITRTGDCVTVHFRMINMEEQVLRQKHPSNMVHPEIANQYAQKMQPTITLKKGEHFDLGYSKRFTRDYYIALFKRAGYKVVSPPSRRTPYPDTSAFPEDRPFKKIKDYLDDDFNGWRLIPDEIPKEPDRLWMLNDLFKFIMGAGNRPAKPS